MLTVSVSVIDATVSIQSTTQLTATVTVTPDTLVNKAVTWTIESRTGATDATLSTSGAFVSGTEEGEVVVKATSSKDSTKYGTATITIVTPIAADGTAAVYEGSRDIVVTLTTGEFAASLTAANWTIGGTNSSTLGAITGVVRDSDTQATVTVTNPAVSSETYTITATTAEFDAAHKAPTTALSVTVTDLVELSLTAIALQGISTNATAISVLGGLVSNASSLTVAASTTTAGVTVTVTEVTTNSVYDITVTYSADTGYKLPATFTGTPTGVGTNDTCLVKTAFDSSTGIIVYTYTIVAD